MKKVLSFTALFIIVLFVSLIVNFPVETAVQYYLNKIGKSAGIDFEYSKGSFSLSGVTLNDVEIYKGNSLLMVMREIKITPGMGNLTVSCKKNGGGLNAVLSKANTDLTFKDFQVVKDSTKLFKKIIITGDLNLQNQEKSGSGKMRINLQESLEPAMIPSDIMAITEFRIEPDEITINVLSLQGVDLRGSGKIVIAPDKKIFNNSKLSGTVNIKTRGTPINVKLTGTVGNPSYSL